LKILLNLYNYLFWHGLWWIFQKYKRTQRKISDNIIAIINSIEDENIRNKDNKTASMNTENIKNKV